MSKELKKIVVFGIGEFSKLVSEYLKEQYEIVAYCANQEYLNTDTFLNKPAVAFQSVEKEYPPEKYAMFVTVGYRNMNELRTEIFHHAKEKGYELVSYVAPSAIIPKECEIGENTLILENVILQPFAKLGKNIFIFPLSLVCHHSVVGDNVFIASHACISGFVNVGDNCFIGANSTVRDNITIAPKTLVGAGCTILKDTNMGEVYKSACPELLQIKSTQLNTI